VINLKFQINIFAILLCVMASFLITIRAETSSDSITNNALVFTVHAPSDLISLTHSGEAPFDLLPETIPELKIPTKDGSFALLVYVRDKTGNRIGFASELEDIPETEKGQKPEDRKTVWTVVIPGRGMLIAYELENISPSAMAAFKYPKLYGKPWKGNLIEKNTVGPLENGYGMIIGGTGEFEGASGYFLEESKLTAVSLSGEMEAVLSLKFFFTKES